MQAEGRRRTLRRELMTADLWRAFAEAAAGGRVGALKEVITAQYTRLAQLTEDLIARLVQDTEVRAAPACKAFAQVYVSGDSCRIDKAHGMARSITRELPRWLLPAEGRDTTCEALHDDLHRLLSQLPVQTVPVPPFTAALG